ncbi:MAG: hypothetical protein KGL11_09375 [Alphaproteobacteria bacterium]|nr:hypothetical protein [Alphaproteobacteria bacterium]
MTTQTQIAANRRNAGKSTGPRTAAGKAAVARNALRHGLTAEHVVLFDEAGDDFAAFHAELRATYRPGDAVEEELVERIVVCAWRLRRAARVEAALLKRATDACRQEWEPRDLSRVCAYALNDLAALSRHESGLDRALRRAEMQLKRRQALRRGEAVAPPIAVAIAGLESADHGGEKIKIDKTKPVFESAAAPHPLPPCQASPRTLG